jgi:hypothetical protein
LLQFQYVKQLQGYQPGATLSAPEYQLSRVFARPVVHFAMRNMREKTVVRVKIFLSKPEYT